MHINNIYSLKSFQSVQVTYKITKLTEMVIRSNPPSTVLLTQSTPPIQY